MTESVATSTLPAMNGVGTGGLPCPDQVPGRNPHFVNHEKELKAATDRINSGTGNQVLVLTGTPPGTGKTATAIELSHRVAEQYPDGRLFYRLSDVDQSGLEAEVLRHFLVTLGVAPQQVPERREARSAMFRSLTARRRLLVFLDGAVSASQVRTLLPGDGESLVLVTERQSLATLGVDTPVTVITLSPLASSAARELLVRLVDEERVAAEPDAVDEIIELCGRLPVALCVAGAMVGGSRVRRFATMLERLTDERRRLDTLSRNEDLAVNAAFGAAYGLLGAPAQRCYRALGLRPRSDEIALDALVAALDMPRYEVAEAVEDLTNARLVEELAGDRILVRDLIALHAEGLDGRRGTDRDADSLRLLEFYFGRCVAADELVAPRRPWRGVLFPELRPRGRFADAASARAWLRTERANLMAAVEYAADLGDHARVVRFCVLLWPGYEKEKDVPALLAVHQHGVTSAERLGDPAIRSLMHTQLGFGYSWLRDPQSLAQAVKELAVAVRFGQDAGNRELEATALEGLGLAQLASGDIDAARQSLRRNFQLAEEIRDPRRIALARLHLAKVEAAERALALLAEAETEFAKQPDRERENLAKVLTWRGKKLVESRSWAAAARDLTAARQTMSAAHRRFDEAEILEALGDLEVGRGALDEAAQRYREALAIYRELGLTARVGAVQDEINRLTGES